MRSSIHLSKLNYRHNVNLLKSLMKPGTIFCSILKSNAYGHGLDEMIELAKMEEVCHFGVDSFREAFRIKEIYEDSIIFVLGYVEREYLCEFTENLILTISSIEQLNLYNTALKDVNISLKVETGTNRQGILLKDFLNAIDLCKRFEANIVSIHSHLANSEILIGNKRTGEQYNTFVKFLEKSKIVTDYIHIGSSASIMHSLPKCNLIRVGLAQYGLNPSKEFEDYIEQYNLELKPIFSLKSTIVQKKFVKKGEFIGYGNNYKAKNDIFIGIIPLGYYDGISRKLSSKLKVSINGIIYEQIGNICMNMFMVKVDSSVNFLDEVILIDFNSDDLSINNWAILQDSINYEVSIRFNKDIPRIIT